MPRRTTIVGFETQSLEKKRSKEKSFMSSRTIDHSGRDEFRKPPEPVEAVETVLEVVSPVVVTGDDSESLREVSSDGE